MSLPPGVRRLLRLRRPERDVADELSYHFELAMEELQAEGMTAAEARGEAERRFGDVQDYQRELERIDGGRMRNDRHRHRLESVRDVVQHAVRGVMRAPGLGVAVILTLALGLGANATMYSIVDRLLVSPPPHVEQPEQLRRLLVEQYEQWRGERTAREHLAWADFRDMTEASLLRDAAVWQEQLLTVGQGLNARQLDALAVSGNYFALLGARPALGRFLTPADDAAEAARAVVISYEMWQREHGGRVDVLGTTLALTQDAPFTVVGVAPQGMTSLRLRKVDIWVPLRSVVSEAILENRNWHGFMGVVRTPDGPSDVAIMEQLSARLRQGRSEHIAAGRFDAHARALLTPLLEARGPLAGDEATVAKWLTGVSLILLLIGAVNVANMLLARALRQSRENAVRLALGISRRRLLTQVLLEGALLGLLGGAAGLLLAHWGGAAISSTLLPDVAWGELGWSPLLVPLTFGLAVLTGIAAAVAPALQATRPELAASIRQAGAGAITRTTTRTRTVLSFAQAALSVVLLVGAGLFVRSLDAVRSMDLGYDMDRLLYVETQFTPGTTTAEERLRLRHEVTDRLRNHPAVAGAAAASTAPFLWAVSNNVTLPGRDTLPLIGTGDHWVYSVTPDYFDVLRIPVLRGRAFDEQEARSGARVAVVNETMARALWPEQDALGGCMLLSGDPECVFVIGIVASTRQQGVREPESAQYFLPLTPEHNAAVVLVRPQQGLRDAADIVRTAVVGVDPRIRFANITSARDRFAPHERSWRLGAAMFSAFGLLALLVAALGLYAVLSFDVAQRTREIGVRSALGAGRGDLLRLVLGNALRITSAGIALGGVAAALLAPRLDAMLFGVGPHDPLTYSGVTVTLLAVAVAAAVLPARRATAVEPNEALRAE